MKYRILATLALLFLALAIYSRLWAVDGLPPGTIPPIIIIDQPEPFRQITYCPIMFGGEGVWLWPASR